MYQACQRTTILDFKLDTVVFSLVSRVVKRITIVHRRLSNQMIVYIVKLDYLLARLVQTVIKTDVSAEN